MDKFLEKYNLPKLREDEGESLKRPITPDELATVIRTLATHKSPESNSFTGEYNTAYKGEITPILHRLFQKIKKMDDSQTHFMKPTSP